MNKDYISLQKIISGEVHKMKIVKDLIIKIIIYLIPLLVLFFEVRPNWQLIFTAISFNIRSISPFTIIYYDITSPSTTKLPLEMQLIYILQGMIIYSVIYIFNLNPSVIKPISEIVIGYVSFLLIFNFQKNLLLMRDIKLKYDQIFLEIGSLFFILSGVITNSFGNLSLASVNALLSLLLVSKFLLSKNNSILKLILYSIAIATPLLFIETDYIPLLPAVIFIIIIFLLDLKDYKKMLKILGTTLVIFLVISYPLTQYYINNLVNADNPLLLSLGVSRTNLSPPKVTSTFLQFSDIFYITSTFNKSFIPNITNINFTIIALLLTALSIIIPNKKKIKSLLIKMLFIVLLTISIYSTVYFNEPIVEKLNSMPLIGILFYVLDNYRVPSFIISLTYSLGISFSSIALYDQLESKFYNNKKILGLLLVIVASLPSIAQAYMWYPAFNTDFSSPGNVWYISEADNCAAYWLYVHDRNGGQVIWLPYFSYPLGVGYLYPFLGPNVIRFPAGSDGPAFSWFFDYVLNYVPERYNSSYIFAKFLSIAGIEYIVLNRNYSGSFYTLDGNTYYHLLNNSSYFTLEFNYSNVYIYKNNLYQHTSYGILGYDFSGLYGESLLFVFDKYFTDLNLITPVEADMEPLPNPLIYRGVLIFTPYSSVITDVMASLIFSNKTLMDKFLIIKPSDFNYTNLFFNTNVYPFLDYESLYQFSYDINYGYLANFGQTQEIYHTQFSEEPGDYIVLVRYMSGSNMNSSINIDGNSYVLPSSLSSSEGFTWYSFEVHLNSSENSLILNLKPGYVINLIMLIGAHEYNELLNQSIRILRTYPVIYVGLIKDNNINITWLKNTTYIYIIPISGTSKITIMSNNIDQFYVINNVTKFLYYNISSIMLQSNTSVVIAIISGDLSHVIHTFTLSNLFPFPQSIISLEGQEWISYPYMGISIVYVPYYS